MLTKYLKNVWFWLAFTPLFYAFMGFLILPWLTISQVPPLLKERLGLNLSVQKITLNPFTFELNINDIALKDTNQSNVIGAKHIYIDYDILPLFHKKIFFKSLIVDTPSVDIHINQDGSLNLIKLFSSIPTSDKEEVSSKSDENPLPLLLGHIEIKNGLIHFEDLTSKEPFSIDVGPFNYTINNLGLEKDYLSIHELKSILDNEEKISFASSATLEPLKFYGELNLKNIQLPKLWLYAIPDIPMKLSKGDFFVHLPFSIDFSGEMPLIGIENANIVLSNLIFKDEVGTTLIHIPKLSADGINLAWPKAEISISKVALLKPFVDIQLEKNYDVNLARLFMPKTQKSDKNTTPTTTSTPSPSWNFKLKTLGIEEGNIEVTDKNVKGIKTKFSPLTLNAQNITSDLNQSIAYDFSSSVDGTSQLKLQGSFVPSTLSLDTAIQTVTLPINKIQPYLEPFTTLLLKEGLLSSQSQLKASFGGNKEPFIKLNAKLDLSKLSILDKFRKPIIAWDKLLVDDIIYVSTPTSLHVGKVTLNKPYVNLDIKKDKTSNFSTILKPTPAKKTPSKTTKPSKQEKPMEMVFGTMSLKQGTANFKDASLPIPFATFINNLNGSFSALDTKNTKPSRLLLEGKVNKYGYAKIEGSLLPFDFKDRANLKVLFKNIDMPSLTPYSGKFLGYAIQKGKLSLDLSYKIKKGMMEGSNKINLDSLTLGDKIESEDAVNLPLAFAIAILKDSKGQIDLNLPVDGDLNSPDFKYGAIVWKAFGNLIGSILTSPFSLIGSILGIETESLKSIEFSAGEYQIIASEEEKMEQYKQILEKKPELKLLITPSFNEELDTLALKEQEINKQIAILTKGSKQENSYSKAIKTLFVKKLSEDAYDKLIKSYKAEKLDVGTINENLKLQIAQVMVITPEELTALAHQRADAIIQDLTIKHKIAPPKILKGELQTSDAIRDEWVGCAVSITN